MRLWGFESPSSHYGTMTPIVRFALIAIGLSAAACSAAPEDAALSAFRSLCEGDEAAFLDGLTPESRRLYQGLVSLDSARFSCPGGADGIQVRAAVLPAPAVSSSTAQEPGEAQGTRTVLVSTGGDEHLVGMVEQDGGWKIDLFWGEDSSFLPFSSSQENP